MPVKVRREKIEELRKALESLRENDHLKWRMKVGRRKMKGAEYPIVQLPAEFRHWIGKPVKLVYVGKSF